MSHQVARAPKARHTFAACLASALIALALLLALPQTAEATRLDTDMVLGQTASAQGISEVDMPDLECHAAIVVGKDGTTYFERNADEEIKIASITKVMTAIVALEHAKLADTITVDEAAAKVGQSSADLKEGDTMPLSTALKALLVTSGNDAAMAIATTIGKKIDPASANPYKTFVEAMNTKAAELGMEHSLFENPHGLDFDGWEGELHSSARDVATMYAYAMQNEDFRRIDADGDPMMVVKGADGAERSIKILVRNEILGQGGNIGGKTGGTYIALQCFVGAFSQDAGGEIYTVTLGSDGSDQRWADTRALANWYYGHTVDYPLVASERTTADGRPLIARVPNRAWSDKTVEVTATDPDAAVSLFNLAGKVELHPEYRAIDGGVRAGDTVGSLVVKQAGKELGKVDLVSAENQDGPDPLSYLLVLIDRAIRFFTGEPGQASAEEFFETPDALALSAH
ncbi:serine hydrolase [Collinsella sp. AGMB00827]|uniref:Serine hydrolase n=2 Tax=Collinsella ureilytica TaxID=2869515 RepID=A0ABS7MIU3_9ACTN|nr:serine hydrolase [Collinsella urealyticum]